MRRPAVQSRVARTVLAMPVAGPLVKKLNVAVIARTLGSLLRNGVPLVQALPLAASVASNREFREALLQSAQTVKEGARVATAFKQSGVFPELALRFVAIGEEASRLDEMLIHLADVEDTQSRRMIETLFNLMTPALTLLIGGMVGGLILSVMQAVLSVNEIAL
jgi:general secretion pathway protein F